MGIFRDLLCSRCVLRVLSVGLLLAAVGCMGQSKAGKLQEAASNLNMATRFGRMDIATELVAAQQMEAFGTRHAGWGGPLRIVDVEHHSIKMVNEDKALVFVTVGWHRIDEGNLRVTQLAQEWSYASGGWRLTDETRTAGDIGLLGEPMEVLRPDHRPNAYFPSITIR
ncbi:MAG: hypothetical protein CSA75_04930 [Sorangium cellulosum]|nr:MAG: hypothetical protein CSA75_04930 [Sorangium cellulosum]